MVLEQHFGRLANLWPPLVLKYVLVLRFVDEAFIQAIHPVHVFHGGNCHHLHQNLQIF